VDPRLLRETINGEDASGVMDKMNETISNQYKLLKQKLKLPDDASDEGGAAGSEGSAMVKDHMRRALHFMTLGRNTGSEGAGSDGRYDNSSEANSQRGSAVDAVRSERRPAASGKPYGSDKGAKVGADARMDAATLHKLKKRQVLLGLTHSLLVSVSCTCFWSACRQRDWMNDLTKIVVAGEGAGFPARAHRCFNRTAHARGSKDQSQERLHLEGPASSAPIRWSFQGSTHRSLQRGLGAAV
jgi:hypothetical protein